MPKSRFTFVFLSAALCANAQVHSLTLQEALAMAARQNPEVILSRLDEQRAQDDIRIAKDPFMPKLYGGSGLAWTYGYPNSIDGNAPSLIQTKTQMALFNRPDSFKLAATRELARGSQFGAQAKTEDIAYQVADLFLSASQTEHQGETLSGEIPSLKKVSESMDAAVSEGTELPLELKRANVNLALSEERLGATKLDGDYYEMMLAVAVGFPASDRVKPIESDFGMISTPGSADDAAEVALQNNRELRQMEANVLAKELDLRSYKAQRLPQVDLVAQYALFAKSNYQGYFTKVQRNNAELGASITLPLLVGSASKGMATEAAIDMQKIRIQMGQARNRIISDTQRSYQQWEKAKTIRDLSRMQLDLARESLTVLLAQNNEGRVAMRQVEQARLEESDRWLALYEAETQVTRAKLFILRQMGTLSASVRGQAPAAIKP